MSLKKVKLQEIAAKLQEFLENGSTLDESTRLRELLNLLGLLTASTVAELADMTICLNLSCHQLVTCPLNNGFKFATCLVRVSF